MVVEQDVRLVDDAASGMMGALRVPHDLLHGLITDSAESSCTFNSAMMSLLIPAPF
jgi:hypothetical protein